MSTSPSPSPGNCFVTRSPTLLACWSNERNILGPSDCVKSITRIVDKSVLDISNFEESGVNANASPPLDAGDRANCVEITEENDLIRFGVNSPLSYTRPYQDNKDDGDGNVH